MKNNVLLILIYILFLSPHSLFAQQTYQVKGNVQSVMGEPLIGANVQLINQKGIPPMVGETTHSNGDFFLSVTKGNYKLKISYMGYISYISNVEVKGDVILPPITLSEDAKLMNEVVVTARTITYNTDGYISEVSRNPLYRNMDMTSVLKMSPGTYTNYNSVQVYGQNVSKVYLNGRELKLYGEQLINYLKTINARNVKEMEVITASGVEEDASAQGKSIIKITTVNPETGGMFNVGANTVNSEDKNIHSMNANVNWRMNKKWGMYFNTNGAFGTNRTGNHTETHFYSSDVRRVNQSVTDGKLNGNFRGVWGVTYDWDKNNLFSLEGTFQHNKYSNPTVSTIRNLTNTTYKDVAIGNIDAVRQYQRYNVSFVFTHKFTGNAQLDLKADRMGTDIDDNSLQHYEYIENDNTGYNHWNKEKALIHTVRLDFTKRFKSFNGKFTTGVKGTWLSNESETDYATYMNEVQDNTASYTDLYKYREDVYALYAKYALIHKNLSLDFGVRMEHSYISPKSSNNPERNQSNSYTDVFPEIGLNYTWDRKNGHNINLGYNRGLGRPHMDYLNPLMRRVGEYNYSTGNPLLKPTYYDIYTLTAVLFNKYTLNVRYNYSNDGILGVTENRNEILYSTYTTGFNRSWLTAHIDIPLKIQKWLDLKIYANYAFNKEKFQKNSIQSHNFNMGYLATIRLPKNYRIENELSHGITNRSIYSKTAKPVYCNVSVYKTFPKQSLNCSLSFMDIFNSYGTTRVDTFRDDFYQISKADYQGFGISIRVNYSFRWGKKFIVRRSLSGNMEEMMRIATE